MKKILSNFADQLISKEQMKKVKGGCGSGGCWVELDSGYGGCGSSQTWPVDNWNQAVTQINSTANLTGWRYWCQ